MDKKKKKSKAQPSLLPGKFFLGSSLRHENPSNPLNPLDPTLWIEMQEYIESQRGGSSLVQIGQYRDST